MQIKGDYTVPAPRERVWEYFTDAALLQQCIPGCEALVPIGDDTYEATLRVGVASIKGIYKGTVKLENQQPPSAYRLVVQGKSKIGFLNGLGDFTLEESQENQTTIHLSGELKIGGKLARVGQRVIGGAARMMMRQFFKAVVKLAESEAST
ncbi:MAG: carbon monoxide dehydrogenase subunit G [Candidatus Poribacteria bacterium]|nr:carbon monoxide dehydrogenase subunit G [Candidatus Poribacteria bacterium]